MSVPIIQSGADIALAYDLALENHGNELLVRRCVRSISYRKETSARELDSILANATECQSFERWIRWGLDRVEFLDKTLGAFERHSAPNASTVDKR